MGYTLIMHSKKKILYVITKSNWGGAQRYVYDLATNLTQEQFNVSVALGGNGLLAERLNGAGIQTIILSHIEREVRVWKDIKIFFTLIRLFRDKQPDIVHLNSSKVGGLGSLAARIARVPCVIFTVHGLPSFEPRFAQIKFLIVFFSWLSCIFNTAIIAVSRADFETMRKWPFLSSKTCLIKNGVSI